jgi:hypothetical protein
LNGHTGTVVGRVQPGNTFPLFEITREMFSTNRCRGTSLNDM